MENYCKSAKHAELVAVRDNYPTIPEPANYANDHAPYAIRSMRAGKHVFSEESLK